MRRFCDARARRAPPRACALQRARPGRNAGVILRGHDTATWGVLLASLVGRPLGMFVAVAVALAAGLHLPRHIGWRELLVIAFATSSGFSIAAWPGPMKGPSDPTSNVPPPSIMSLPSLSRYGPVIFLLRPTRML